MALATAPRLTIEDVDALYAPTPPSASPSRLTIRDVDELYQAAPVAAPQVAVPVEPLLEEAVARLSGEPVLQTPRFTPVLPRPAPARGRMPTAAPADAAFQAAGLISPGPIGAARTP